MVGKETEGVLVPLLVLLLLWVMLGYDGKEELVLVYVLLFPNLKKKIGAGGGGTDGWAGDK